MTIAARKVLKHCKIAWEMLESEQDAERFRVLWAGGVALLRTVGDALHRVDGARDKKLMAHIRAAYERWKKEEPEESIFFGFIKSERDSILHEFDSSSYSGNFISLAIIEQNDAMPSEIFETETDLYRPFLGKYGHGEDVRDLFGEAIDWWDAELSLIENSGN